MTGCVTADLDERSQVLVGGIKDSNPSIVQRGLEMSADVHIKGTGKNSLLHLAVRPNRQGFEKLLSRKDGSIETGELTADSSVFTELLKNRVEVVKLLILHGVPVNVKNSRNETPLYSAIACLPSDNPDIPSIPPVAGRISSPFGWRNAPISGERDYHRAIDIAAQNGTIIRAAACGRVKATGINDQLGLFIVLDHENGYQTTYGHCHIVDINRGTLVKKGELIGYVGETGNAQGNHCHFEVRLNSSPVDPLPYLLAGIYGELSHQCAMKFVEILIENGANPNVKNSYGRTPLHEACAKNPEIARFLIEHGGNLNSKDNNGVTPLHEASARNGDLVKYLISKNVNINCRSVLSAAIDGKLYPAGTTPLGVAKLSGQADVAVFLESRGAIQ